MTTRIVIDTDLGSDDYLAMLFLLTRNDIIIEAITIVHGLCDVEKSSKQLLSLLAYLGHKNITVYCGETKSLFNNRTFPIEWKNAVNLVFDGIKHDLTNIDNCSTLTAVEFLTERIQDPNKGPFKLLALGPLTNIALALRRVNTSSSISTPLALQEVIIMGGAINIPGNLSITHTADYNIYAEWNIYCDPEAAHEVLSYTSSSYSPSYPNRLIALKVTLIGLDATNKVRITTLDVDKFNLLSTQTQTQAQSNHSYSSSSIYTSKIRNFISAILEYNKEYISNNTFYAWDPLIAVYIVYPDVVQLREGWIQVCVAEPEIGRTRLIGWSGDDNTKTSTTTYNGVDYDKTNDTKLYVNSVYIAIDAYPHIFHEAFFTAFT